jgi:transketolase
MKKLLIHILENAYESQEGHVPSSLSILDILWVLYSKILNIDPKNPTDPNRDFFILSKGHAALGLYSVLAERGFFTPSEMKKFCRYDSKLGGHPNRIKVCGVEASTGSLGHGFPIAVGIAKGLKIQKKKQRVFVLIGDGESNEGTIWESALLAVHHKLDNLCCIIDHNHSTDRALDLQNLENKFASFGWQSLTVDGHDQKQVEKALKTKHSGIPLAIIANTIKGRGISSLENNPAWHHKSPNKEEFETLMKEIA